MKRDVINLHLALTNNIASISFSSSLDPLIKPLEPFSLSFNSFDEYLDFYDHALEIQNVKEPEIVEYYLLKHKLKSFEEIIDDYEGYDEDFVYFININDFLTYGNETDFFLVDYFTGKYLESFNKEKAIDFYEEGERVACERGNELGMKICRDNYERLVRNTEDN
ncbi:hypothetical protein H311_02805 [Anncaliia algerae PRA109]|nr:hypothetical protein H311_02805 [Anncaliia algerae PRA109]